MNNNASYNVDDEPVDSRFIRHQHFDREQLNENIDERNRQYDHDEQPPADFDKTKKKKKFPFLRKGQGFVSAKYPKIKLSTIKTSHSSSRTPIVSTIIDAKKRKPFEHLDDSPRTSISSEKVFIFTKRHFH